MSISYNAVVGFKGKVTLPSSDSWNTNQNIIRDPPKSIHTRRIDKVGENSSIIEIIDQSGDRGCEAISKYARGINPAVSVSYSNVTNNAGTNVLSNVRSAKMPYTIMQNQGAFRPPIQTQYELLPLSRQPRELTSVSTNASIIDFSRKMLVPQPASKTKEVKTTKLFTLVRPTVTNKILGNKSSQKPNGIENMIQAKVKINTDSRIRNKNGTYKEDVNLSDSNYINKDIIHPAAKTNTKHDKHVNGVVLLETDRFIQNHNSVQATTNIQDNTKYTRIDFLNDIELTRNIPVSNFSTNIISKGPNENNSREKNLKPKISYGGFQGKCSIPSQKRITNTCSSSNIKKQTLLQGESRNTLNYTTKPEYTNRW